ncbi:MAG: TMEM175 family protein [Coriobacteriales bacterium]|jgi:uncharacterized membrane protein|nr:TMEM175 family protein [Coriobacteriales bacterium]
MSKSRLEAFTDAVIAIVMTILILEISTPLTGGVEQLWELRFEFLVYLVSFLTLAVYWNNHHHIFQAARHVSGAVLWCNILLLLFLSLIPFSTAWVDGFLFDLAPELFYGANMLAADIVWLLMTKALVAENGTHSDIARALDGSHKSWLSIGVIVLGLLVGLIAPVATLISCIISMIPWLIPDRRIEKLVKEIQRDDAPRHTDEKTN